MCISDFVVNLTEVQFLTTGETITGIWVFTIQFKDGKVLHIGDFDNREAALAVLEKVAKVADA